MIVIQLINLDVTQILVKFLMNLHHTDTNEGFTQDAVCILSQVVYRCFSRSTSSNRACDLPSRASDRWEMTIRMMTFA